jgi:spore maturation protein CgeB
MNIALFYHSLVSDWNHGNAHFLRGIATELQARGHAVRVFEPANGWSVANLIKHHGQAPLKAFQETFAHLCSTAYRTADLDLDQALQDVDLVVVHEWNDPELICRIGRYRIGHPRCRALFHDTHHRACSEPGVMGALDLSGYDGVLAFGEVIRRIYLQKGWARRAWTWHEAADTRLFHPIAHAAEPEGDLVWIGNWGDEERTAAYTEFLIEPVKALNIRARVYGVQYPADAVRMLDRAGIAYGGWLPNYKVPQIFARYRVTLHIPRGPYVRALPGIPTIRPFEALACGIPLICAPWNDAERLFTPGRDFLMARNGTEMKRHLYAILSNPRLAAELAAHGRQTILARHTCAHRVDQLLAIAAQIGLDVTAGAPKRSATEGAELVFGADHNLAHKEVRRGL